ncbi:hypothetical protein QBC42DRAFT_308140 [Cladorrhinum samala]|uniref:Uncharacterized protein n=1 Tax=Cladorrhinum samala TaxID=585594 RepID=A0AAV9HIX2_9PEZI|nr:hypothetical protein QBC42DRAFT_308140 [Cladorrhinum samala]
MKQGILALSALGWLQLAAAGCCRTNKCLKAVAMAPEGIDGVLDCKALLEVTVTPAASAVTETVTEVPTEYASLVDTAVFTETVTTTVSTDIQLVTLGTAVTDATHTEIVTVTETLLATETTQVTGATVTAVSTVVYRRGDTELGPAIPTYAEADCPSWEKYVSACKCAGVTPATITAAALEPTTVTVPYTDSAVIVSVPTTISTTTTVYESVTATEAATETSTLLMTATASVTSLVPFSSTVTITQTVTATVSPPAPSCKPAGYAFQAWFRDVSVSLDARHLYANLISSSIGGPLYWKAPATSTSASALNPYIWSFDSDGYLMLAYGISSNANRYYAYISTSNPGSATVQIMVETNLKQVIETGGASAMIRGCVDPATSILSLEAAGRKNLLYCGGQVGLSAGAGEDLSSTPPCLLVQPKTFAA